MSETAEDRKAADPTEGRSIRPVVEHALIDYGYSPETTRIILDKLISEGVAE
jgi:hypothetical protein